MNAQELYERLKEAANYFGVGFHGFALIDARIEEGELVLRCNGQSIRFPIGGE
ncbi:hypothetical protein [Pseudomonas phage PMBT14]|uniref:Uncharacterized protein n=1 Tax=Pseudomonas phage PMBT14 TaxID=2059855 RepID=A0A2I6PIB9_9CAUD|nr:hypothetical protein HWB42_gp64 [Pseudomonas phage PMBT14]AUM59782.1 hypothetical protein [Pseudomonas phage PMBT14]